MKKIKIRRHEFVELMAYLKPCIAHSQERNIPLRLAKKVLFDLYLKLTKYIMKDHTKKEYTISMTETEMLAFQHYWNITYSPTFLINFYMTINKSITV